MSANDFRFRLFIVGDEPNSRLADKNLHAICSAYLPGRHHIEVIDVMQNFEAALAANIMIAPALVVEGRRSFTLFGALTDEAMVLSMLGLDGEKRG
jgi:circadian clock protein KaiB